MVCLAPTEVEIGSERFERVVETPRGSPENPLSDDELEEKFRRQAGTVLNEAAVDRVVALVEDLPRLEDVTVLTEALVG